MLPEHLHDDVIGIVKAAFGQNAQIESVEVARISALNTAIDLRLSRPNGRYFIKIENELILPSTRRGQIEREVVGLGLARQAGIPCPAVIHYDCTRARVSKKYLLAEFVAGDLLWEMQDKLTGEDRSQLQDEMAAVLEAMNTIISPCFGDPFADGPLGQHATWAGAYRAIWRLLEQDCQELGLFRPEEWELIQRAFQVGAGKLVACHPAGLIHGDLGIHNVIAAVREGRPHIGSVIDFGNCLFGPIFANEDGVRLHGGWGLEPVDVCEKYGITAAEYQADSLLFSFEMNAFFAFLSRQNGCDMRKPAERFLGDCRKMVEVDQRD